MSAGGDDVAAVASGIVEAWWRDNAYIEMTQRSIDRLEAAIVAALQRERRAPVEPPGHAGALRDALAAADKVVDTTTHLECSSCRLGAGPKYICARHGAEYDTAIEELVQRMSAGGVPRVPRHPSP